VAALALCLAASACDSSPYAVMVDNHALSQSTLNGQLSQLSANRAFIQTVESSQGAGIHVTGDGSASYSSEWTAAVLTAAATAAAVHQHLVATGNLPSQAQIQAVQAVDAAAYSSGLTWYQFTPAIRALIVQRDADMAQVVPTGPNVNPGSLKRVAHAYATSLFTRVCLRTIEVSVPGAGGNVNFPASQAKAKAVVAAINKAGTAGANRPSLGGSVDCYGQTGFAGLPLPVVKGALQAKAGAAAPPERNSDGYQVVGVVSRTPLDTTSHEFSQAISVLVQVNSLYSGGSTVPAIKSLVSRAHVRVDPMYGTWRDTKNGWAVVPPSGPAPHAASVAGSI